MTSSFSEYLLFIYVAPWVLFVAHGVFVAVCGPLLEAHGLSSWDTLAYLPHGTWGLHSLTKD